MTSVPRHRQTRLAPSITSNSKTSQQHVSLSRRLLFPQLPPSSDLPPLLASPSMPPELTSELYDFIALALRAFVNPWWSKITRYDKEFLPEVTRILTFVIRVLEAKILATDLSPLVFRDIPILITQHYRDFRTAESKLGTSYATGGASPLPHLFHNLQPHMALCADGSVDQEYFRLVIDHILKTCLPPEDYQSDAERYIIREIALKVLLQDIIPKVSQPWFIHKTILDLLGPDHDELLPQKPPAPVPSTNTTTTSPLPPTSFSLHTFLIIFLSAIQSLSSACLAFIHTYKQALNTIKLVNQAPTPTRIATPSRSYPSPSPSPPLPPSTLTPPHPPLRLSPSNSASSSVSARSLPLPAHMVNLTPGENEAPLANDFSRTPLVMVSEIFTTHERLASGVIVNSISMISASMTPFLDRLLPHLLTTALSPQFITRMLRISKRNLFPNGYPVPTPPDPTPEEQAALKEKLVKWRPRGALAHLMPFLLGPSPEITLSAALDPLSSTPCNVHLIVFILDRLLMGLFPELGAGMTMP